MANYWLRKPNEDDTEEYILGYLDRKIPRCITTARLHELIDKLEDYRETQDRLLELERKEAAAKTALLLGKHQLEDERAHAD
jgi:hypothetical protein